MPNNFLHIFRIGVLSLAMGMPALACADTSAEVLVPAPARQAELLNLIRQDCGSCHGMRLGGGLGLPLTPQALKEKSPNALKQTVLYGRGGTPMPPWAPFLTEDEADWIVETLLKGLP